MDGARGSRPQIFAYEDLVDRAVLEIVPRTKSAIPKGTKVCAHYSKSFTELHPGTVSSECEQDPLLGSFLKFRQLWGSKLNFEL